MTSASTAGDHPTSYAIVTLGCARNEVDSEQLAGVLSRDGYEHVTDPAAADVVLVNTCTFITPATEESVDTVLAACDLKSDRARAVLVVGCMAERYRDDLAESIPEADAVIGFGGYPRLPEIVDDLLAGRPVPRYVGSASSTSEARSADATGTPAAAKPGLPTLPIVASGGQDGLRADTAAGVSEQDRLDRIPQTGPRFPTRARRDDRPWAYLKIAGGCDRACTFCAIPSWRGGFRSRPPDEIVDEARWLVDGGARELVLVSENTTSWGKDLARGGRDLQPRLLEALSDIDGLETIRLMYLQPDEVQRPLLEAMAGLDKVASYFDLSLQHVSASVLERMARSGSPQRFRELVAEIRDLDPDAVFRSNFIVGFPGETDDDVADLAAFLEDARLDWVGLFTFSPQDETPAAAWDDRVDDEEAMRRLRELSDVQEHVADLAAARFVGRRLDVTVQETGAEGNLARSYREAPDTDGEIRLVTDAGAPVALPVGRTVPADVVGAHGVDLVAVPDMTAHQRDLSQEAGTRAHPPGAGPADVPPAPGGALVADGHG